ncbi:MAG TPA: hypothetical protein VFX96_02935, partial [Pyrinomonadaceae bacterium]|nr:hypothetical protein [Pyrinomonadaceae bacterium]
MRTRTHLRAAALCLSLPLALFAPATPARAQERDFILFAVAGEGTSPTIDPIVSVSGGKYVFPEGAGGVDEELQKFSAAYYKEGRKYRVISGG